MRVLVERSALVTMLLPHMGLITQPRGIQKGTGSIHRELSDENLMGFGISLCATINCSSHVRARENLEQ